MADKRKQSLYFPAHMLTEIQMEAARQDRSLSWIVQKAWKIAGKKLREHPTHPATTRDSESGPDYECEELPPYLTGEDKHGKWPGDGETDDE